MTNTKGSSEILPADSKGRVRVSRERREELLDEFERSGMTLTHERRLRRINEKLLSALSGNSGMEAPAVVAK